MTGSATHPPNHPPIHSPTQLPTPAFAARIEDMRRAISGARPSAGADDVELTELVGEGTFGKVYKGER